MQCTKAGKLGSHAQVTSGTSSPFRPRVCFGLCWLPGQQNLFLSFCSDRSWQCGHGHLTSCNLSALWKTPTRFTKPVTVSSWGTVSMSRRTMLSASHQLQNITWLPTLSYTKILLDGLVYRCISALLGVPILPSMQCFGLFFSPAQSNCGTVEEMHRYFWFLKMDLDLLSAEWQTLVSGGGKKKGCQLIWVLLSRIDREFIHLSSLA